MVVECVYDFKITYMYTMHCNHHYTTVAPIDLTGQYANEIVYVTAPFGKIVAHPKIALSCKKS